MSSQQLPGVSSPSLITLLTSSKFMQFSRLAVKFSSDLKWIATVSFFGVVCDGFFFYFSPLLILFLLFGLIRAEWAITVDTQSCARDWQWCWLGVTLLFRFCPLQFLILLSSLQSNLLIFFFLISIF